jgi:tRNA U34 5-methylaminomethyl-2-thiouridine-forming methyltransferase MnmC
MKFMQVVLTKDGSHTIYLPEVDENYHSLNGAITESMHVFINAGLNFCRLTSLNIFEMGFGTGLNALLTWLECKKQGRKVHYSTVELNPLKNKITEKLNYEEKLGLDQGYRSVFRFMHNAPWGKEIMIDKHFFLYKFQGSLDDFDFRDRIDLIYFDAFSPDRQPDVWKYEIFEKLFSIMNSGAVLATYCAKGKIKRILKEAGFMIEILPGSPGKREMIRAIKS